MKINKFLVLFILTMGSALSSEVEVKKAASVPKLENPLTDSLWINLPSWRQTNTAESRKAISDSLERLALPNIKDQIPAKVARELALKKIAEVKENTLKIKKGHIKSGMTALEAIERMRDDLLPLKSSNVNKDFYQFLSLSIERNVDGKDSAEFEKKYLLATSVFQQSYEKSLLKDAQTRKTFLESLSEQIRKEREMIAQGSDQYYEHQKKYSSKKSPAIDTDYAFEKNACEFEEIDLLTFPLKKDLSQKFLNLQMQTLIQLAPENPKEGPKEVPKETPKDVPKVDPFDKYREPTERGNEVPIYSYPRGELEQTVTSADKKEGQVSIGLNYTTPAGSFTFEGAATINYTTKSKYKLIIYSASSEWPIVAKQNKGGVEINDLNQDSASELSRKNRLIFHCVFENVAELEESLLGRVKYATPLKATTGNGGELSGAWSKIVSKETIVRRVSPVVYVPYFVPGTKTEMTLKLLKEECEKLYNDTYEKSMATEIEVTLKALEYSNPQNQCRGVNEKGDKECKDFFIKMKTIPSVMRSTKQRCIASKDEDKNLVFYCRLRGDEGSACSMRDENEKLLTSGMFEFVCDTGLTCRFTYIPPNAFMRTFNSYEATCQK